MTALAALGFAFVEVGTVTAALSRATRASPVPAPTDRGVVNRMGFNNDGSAAVAARLRRLGRWRRRPGRRVVVGVNIGKSAVVPDEHAVVDFVPVLGGWGRAGRYLVVNVSSPNTAGLRDLQALERLRPLLSAVRTAADRAARRHVPLLVKIAPDLTDEDVLAVADLALELGLDGIVATNTTTSRDGLSSTGWEVHAAGAGGLSGPRAARALRSGAEALRGRVGDRLVLVSVGGIETAADVPERLRAGATLVQAYTAFVYGGPLWPRRVNDDLARRLGAQPGCPPMTTGSRAAARRGTGTWAALRGHRPAP